MSQGEPVVVCLGYPALFEPRYAERLREIDPRIEPIPLPVDPDGEWLTVPPHDPHPEPPPWAAGCAAARREALDRAEVLIALHTPRDLLTLAPNLRWVQGIGAGMEQFAAAGVTQSGVIVTNASGVSSGSMAEFVVARLLQIWKRFPEAAEHQRSHDYIRTYGRTFAGSVIGIVGMGSIGTAVAQRARALGCHVLGLKRSHGPGATSDGADEMFGPQELHAMLARCDAIVVAAPATPETFHIIDAAAIAAAKPGAMLVNVARGSLVDERAVLDALENKQLSAAALDVFEEEPLPVDSPLWEVPNLYVSAHSSVSVDRYVDDVFALFEENLACYVKHEPMRNVIDLKVLGFE